ncbi:hypothetical protein WMY93_005762 [Mugilogobius chulae]|uniref:Uncharacterized protein n=1 Tax=Mugilogobius chulae TaxID=88201 RepID=A0AAW0PKP4_9GOBI
MKTSRAVLVFCLLTLTALCCQSASSIFPTLNSTEDLRRVYSHRSIPEQSLLLLHMFANKIYIDNHDNIYPSFNPTTDYGSHGYWNYENLLVQAPPGCRYYTIGNVNKNTCSNSRKVPQYVRHPKGLTNVPMENRARIIFCLNIHWKTVHEVYLTQHYRWQTSSAYDPNHTFRITPHLLRELRSFSFNDDVTALQSLRDQYNQNLDDTQLNNIINIWGRHQAPLGLLISLILNMFRRRTGRSSGSEPMHQWQNCEFQQINVYLVTGSNGNAKILWSGVPQHVLKDGAAVVLFNNENDKTKRGYKQIKSSEGSLETSMRLNEGLQARLHTFKRSHWWESSPKLKNEICRGEEFHGPDSVPVTGSMFAKLQLFVRNGKSCFRLYIDNCREWKSHFGKSWVALYTSISKSTRELGQWQWVTKFKQAQDSGDFKSFEHCTRTTVVPGMQARFMIKDYNAKAYTPTWPNSRQFSRQFP